MVIEQTMEKLKALKLAGMVSALTTWTKTSGRGRELDPADLVGLLADAEWTERENRRRLDRLRKARFRESATIEEIDYEHPRNLLKSKVLELAAGRWLAAHQNAVITGETGIGKTYLACALGEKACRDGHRVLYTRAPRLFGDLYRAHADGTYPRLMQKLAKTQLLVIDDFGLAPLEARERRDLREVMEDRAGVSSTLIATQLDPDHWHSVIGDETIADGILDRIVHNAHRIKLKGESIRKKRGMAGPDHASRRGDV